MAGELFKKAAAYRKKHKGMSMPDAVKAVSKKKGTTKKKVGAAPKSKTRTKVIRRGNKVIKKTRTITWVSGIGGISLQKINQEHHHKASLEKALQSHLQLLKQKDLSTTEKNNLRREIKHYRNAISACNQHIRSLKTSL